MIIYQHFYGFTQAHRNLNSSILILQYLDSRLSTICKYVTVEFYIERNSPVVKSDS